MWRDHPFSQRNMATERTVQVVVGGGRKVREEAEGWTKFEKGEQAIQGVFIKQGRLVPLYQLFKETFKIFHSPYFKTNPLPLAAPPFLVNNFHVLTITAVFGKFHPRPHLYEGRMWWRSEVRLCPCLMCLVSVIICILNCEEFIYGTFEDCMGLCNSHYCSSYFRISTR